MQYWLMKSEPDVFSWDDLVRDGRTDWTGVRNFQAANNLRAMQIGDRAFFYHSNIGLQIVGTTEIVSTAVPDPTDEKGKFVMVGVKPLKPFNQFVTLKEIKADPCLQDMALIRQSRLSVCAVAPKEWKHICKLGKI